MQLNLYASESNLQTSLSTCFHHHRDFIAGDWKSGLD